MSAKITVMTSHEGLEVGTKYYLVDIADGNLAVTTLTPENEPYVHPRTKKMHARFITSKSSKGYPLQEMNIPPNPANHTATLWQITPESHAYLTGLKYETDGGVCEYRTMLRMLGKNPAPPEPAPVLY